MSTNQNYQAWVAATGGGSNWEYMAWIAKQEKVYLTYCIHTDADVPILRFTDWLKAQVNSGEQKRGRPATERGAYNPNPARQLGRVSDSDWQTLKEAAEARGKTFTEWALEILLKAAKRQSKS